MSQAEVDQFDAAPPGRDGRNVTAVTASGLRWSYVGSAGLMLANLAYTATISRLLSPVAFGLMALANLVVLFGQFFAHMGLSSALVHKRELSTDEIRAASTAGIVFGAACFAVVWLLTPAISAVFRQPALSPVLRTLSVSFLIAGWSTTGEGLLRRELRFRQLSTLTVGSYAFGYLIVGVGSALLGAGVWSLVAGSLVATAVMAGWQYALVRHPIRPALRWQPYRTVCGFGMRLSGAHLLDYVGSNLDTFMVGRFTSTAVVGQYSRGYYLAVQPIGNYAAQALTSVLFASLSRIQYEMARLGRAYLSLLSLGGVVLFPVCTGVAVAAPELVLVVLGPQWDQVAGMVPWFAQLAASTSFEASQSLAEVRAELNMSPGPAGGVPGGARRAPRGRGRLPVTGAMGVRRRRRRRRGPPLCRLFGVRATNPGAVAASDAAVVCAGGAGERLRGAGRCRRSLGARRRGADPGGVRGRDRCRCARARAVYPVLPAAGRPPGTVAAPDRGGRAGRRRRVALAARAARAGPAGSRCRARTRPADSAAGMPDGIGQTGDA